MTKLVKCKLCELWTVIPCNAANDNIPNKVVTVACDNLLRKKSQNRRTAIFIDSLGLSRLEIPNWVNDQICDHLWRGGKIFWPDGTEFKYDPGDIDDAFNNDPDFRMISVWLACIRNGGPWQRTSKCSLNWHRLFTLAVRLYSREIAKKIAM